MPIKNLTLGIPKTLKTFFDQIIGQSYRRKLRVSFWREKLNIPFTSLTKKVLIKAIIQGHLRSKIQKKVRIWQIETK